MHYDLTQELPTELTETLLLLTPIVDFILKSGLVVGIAFFICRVFGQKLHAGYRHLIFLSAFVIIFLIPLLSLNSQSTFSTSPSSSAPASSYEVITLEFLTPDSRMTGEENEANTGGSTESKEISWQDTLLFAYAFICFGLVLRILKASLQAIRISNNAITCTELDRIALVNKLRLQLNISRQILIKQSNEISAPVSFGLFNPVIIFPACAEDWPERAFEVALIHELCHISRLDWLINSAGYLYCAICWFNPFAWILLSRIETEAECACDLAVTQQGIDKRDYAEDLVFITRSCKAASENLLMQNMLSVATLKSRIAVLLKTQSASTGDSVSMRLALLSVSVVCLITLGAGKVLYAIPVHALPFGDQFTRGPILPALAIRPRIGNGSAAESESNPQLASPNEWYEDLAPLQVPATITYEEQRFQSGQSVAAAVSAQAVTSLSLQFHNVALTIKLPEVRSHSESLRPTPNSGIAAQTHKLITDTRLTDLPGLSRSVIQNEIKSVLFEYYRVFNSNQDDKSLHIVCGEHRPTGSFIPRGYCEPRFVTDARSEDFYNSVRALEHKRRFLNSPVAIQSATHAKFNELTSEINKTLNNNSYFRELHDYLAALRSAI